LEIDINFSKISLEKEIIKNELRNSIVLKEYFQELKKNVG
jgi:hypothetical protein